MYSTVYTEHKNATNVTPQQKIHTKKIFENIKWIKVKMCTARNLLGLLVPVHICFKEVALVTADGKLFQHETQR